MKNPEKSDLYAFEVDARNLVEELDKWLAGDSVDNQETNPIHPADKFIDTLIIEMKETQLKLPVESITGLYYQTVKESGSHFSLKEVCDALQERVSLLSQISQDPMDEQELNYILRVFILKRTINSLTTSLPYSAQSQKTSGGRL